MLSRDTLIDKPDLLKRIGRVRRWSRNGDITAICDSLEHVLKCGIQVPTHHLASPKDHDTGRLPAPQVTQYRVQDRVHHVKNVSS